jgi:tetratricopeptide (TPR) repeat protein
LLNARRFAWSRFLPFAVLALSWGAYISFGPEFAVVFAAVLALNGQEWFQDRFGIRGHVEGVWTLWSTGGRLVTLAAIFFCVGVAITGWRKGPQEPRFGFSYDPDDFPFEAASYLASREDIKGNVFNTTAAQGDALIWKAFPGRRTFLDGRTQLFSKEVLEDHHQLRLAIRDDDASAWKPALDKYGISVVMIDSGGAPATYQRLMQSPNWIPFYDDGRVVMFGRADASEPDRTTFKNNRLEPELRAYHVSSPVPSADRPPTPTSWIDDIFQNRILGATQSHTNAAGRWLQNSTMQGDQSALPDPARCLLAIREARTALARNPDDWVAYRLLNAAYRFLSQQETAILGGLPLNQENQARIAMVIPNIELLSTRFRQRVTAINYAILTTPPPRTPEARRELQALNLELFQLFGQAGYADLARDRLQMALEQSEEGDFTPEVRAQYQQQLDQLNERVKQIEESLMDLQLERQAGPIEKGLYARSQGAIGLALGEFEEAERGSMSPMVVRPQLVDLYCNTGQPDRAAELITMGASEDPNLGTEPGISFMRQGQIYLLLGNYLSAATLWQDRAIPRLRFDRSLRSLSLGRILLRGEAIGATSGDLSLPGQVSRQALWEFDLAQSLLESGTPERAAEHFTQALNLSPDHTLRPLIAYYLEKLGKPVPALPSDLEATPARTPSALDQLLPASVPTPSRPATTVKPPSTEASKATSEPTRPADSKSKEEKAGKDPS